jgi:mannose-6-phosphate isomerase class I
MNQVKATLCGCKDVIYPHIPSSTVHHSHQHPRTHAPTHPPSSPARQHTQVYKDSNHKPEMALALSTFEALCGFVGHEDLVAAFDAVPELRDACGSAAADSYAASLEGEARRAALREAFTALMTAGGDAPACSWPGRLSFPVLPRHHHTHATLISLSPLLLPPTPPHTYTQTDCN